MNGAAFLALAPLLTLSGGAVLLMLLVAARRSPSVAYWVALASLVGAAASVYWASAVAGRHVTPLLLADDYALFFTLLFCLCGAVTAVFARDYLRGREGQQEEFFLLLILSTLGAATLAYATHLASLLLGLELLSVALYALIAYPDRGNLPLEAAIKYLVLSGAASAVFLFGFALVYAVTGTLSYDSLGAAIGAAIGDTLGTTLNSTTIPGVATGAGVETGAADRPLLLAGAAMILVGLGFKLSAVPFHLWTPDVYEGAPAPVSGFLGAVSKAAVFVAVLRWWLASELHQFTPLVLAVAALAGASMLVGNLLALMQRNVKRLLAYSSIAHIGYLLIVLVACGLAPRPDLAVEAAGFYLVAYTVTTLAAFGLVGLISIDGTVVNSIGVNGTGVDGAGAGGAGRGIDHQDQDRDRDHEDDLHGLFWRAPGLALLLTVALLSLAGIPLTAGFIGKFYLFLAGVDTALPFSGDIQPTVAALWALLGLLVIGSAIGIYYYLRLVYAMTRRAGTAADGLALDSRSISARIACYALLAALLYLGILPGWLMDYLRTLL